MEPVYRNLPKAMAPQLKQVFAKLLRDEGPLVYNCSAGQDRTGFVTAMILTALGTPRDVILADYHLSTRYRHPENEMPKLDPSLTASNPVAALFAGYQSDPQPNPLFTADDKPFLSFAFAEIEAKWGSVDAYLKAEVDITPAAIAKLRVRYTNLD